VAFDEKKWMDEAMAEVTTDLVKDDAPSDELTKEEWKVDSVQTAEWAVSKIASELKRYTAIRAACDEYRRRLAEKEKAALAAYQAVEDGFLRHLVPWAQEHLEGSKKRSVDLLNGKLSVRRSPASVVVLDEAKAIKALKDHPKAEELVRVKESIAKAEVKALMKEGERVDGLRLVDGTDKWSVECE
tara:strand:+ start:666 stop:1223 length:558 start_codon:yes stop_codon:yes gene_type:complete